MLLSLFYIIFSVQIFAMSCCASIFTLIFFNLCWIVNVVRRECASYHAPQVTYIHSGNVHRNSQGYQKKKLSGNCTRSIDLVSQCGKFYVGFLHLLRNILLFSYQWTKPAIAVVVGAALRCCGATTRAHAHK